MTPWEEYRWLADDKQNMRHLAEISVRAMVTAWGQSRAPKRASVSPPASQRVRAVPPPLPAWYPPPPPKPKARRATMSPAGRIAQLTMKIAGSLPAVPRPVCVKPRRTAWRMIARGLGAAADLIAEMIVPRRN